MKTKIIWAKILTIGGIILVALPILAPIVFGLISLAGTGQFRFDYLMPAEYFPIVLIGAVLLLLAAIQAKKQVKLIAWLFGGVLISLTLLMIVPIATGAANDINGPTGIVLVALQTVLVLFWLAVIALLTGGIFLVVELFTKKAKEKQAV